MKENKEERADFGQMVRREGHGRQQKFLKATKYSGTRERQGCLQSGIIISGEKHDNVARDLHTMLQPENQGTNQWCISS